MDKNNTAGSTLLQKQTGTEKGNGVPDAIRKKLEDVFNVGGGDKYGYARRAARFLRNQ